MRWAFGDCLLDSAARELTRQGRRLTVSPKAFDLLCALLEHRPRVVSKSELHDRLWPNTFVGGTSVPRLVTEIRKVIDDTSKEPRLIRTFRRFGYAFCGEARALATGVPAGPGKLSPFRLIWGEKEIRLGEGENILGRAPDCVATIGSPKVSRHHARIFVAGGTATLEDLRSKNGTFLRGRKLETTSALRDGDEIVIGPALLVFRVSGEPGSTETERP